MQVHILQCIEDGCWVYPSRGEGGLGTPKLIFHRG